MFKYILKKEFLLIFRNIHALLVLFVMPSVFIIIMSLALKNTYTNSIDVKFNVLIKSEKTNKNISELINNLKENEFFNITYSDIDKNNNYKILYDENYDFVVHIPSDYLKAIMNSKDMQIDVFSKPEISLQNINLLKSFINSNISKQLIKSLLLQLNLEVSNVKDFTNSIKHAYIFKNNRYTISSVQQSVPAWLIFSMFFILIPISNTFINEKNFGTLDRIKSINISMFLILLGKLLPYYIINMIQVLFMILLGIYVIPLLGGGSLEIRGSIGLVFILSSVVSLGAISFALLIANLAKKTEDATTLGGVTNIIFAALGGIMVPKFIMPENMQTLSELSPMSWALNSYIEVLVNGGGILDIFDSVLKLITFAILCFFISYILLKRK